jgi:hypothetical protein
MRVVAGAANAAALAKSRAAHRIPRGNPITEERIISRQGLDPPTFRIVL